MKVSGKVVVLGTALVLGLFSGEAYAGLTYSPGTQTLPFIRPNISVFSTLVQINNTNTILNVEIGRDDTSPWASIVATVTAPGSLAGPPHTFVYRPLWDTPGLANRPGFPESDYFAAQWTACDVFARHATTLRANMGNNGVGLQMYANVSSTANAYHLEFYKYQMTW